MRSDSKTHGEGQALALREGVEFFHRSARTGTRDTGKNGELPVGEEIEIGRSLLPREVETRGVSPMA